MEVRIDFPSKNENVIDSAVSIINYDNNNNIISSKVINTPLGGKDIETEDVKSRLEEVLYRSLHFTSKFCGIDELTGEKFKDEEIRMYILKYINIYSSHHCAGNIMYHPKNEYMLKWLDLMFLNQYGIIPKCNLVNKKIKMIRSSGLIDEDCNIGEDDGLLWREKHNDYIIRIGLDNGINEKYVTLGKIFEYNPELDLEITLPEKSFYMDCPEWVNEVYDEWISGMERLKFGTKEIKILFEKELK